MEITKINIETLISVLMTKRVSENNWISDIVPAVSSILKAEEYRARSHDRQLNQFEMKVKNKH